MSEDSTREFVRDRLIKTLSAIQSNAGRETPAITNETVPFDDLPGFDSLNAVESSVILSSTVEVEISETVFFPQNGSKHLTLGEIVEAIVANHGSHINEKLMLTQASISSATSGAS
jgi:acyl carrier protein